MEYEGILYDECDNVYPPSEDTFLLIDNLEVEEGSKVLEIGGGTGLVSITASKTAKHVTVTDINPYAINCIQHNIELNNRTNILVKECDLFNDIDEKYDLIIFNTPYLPVLEEEHDSSDEYQKAWDGGVDGRQVIDKFLDQVRDYLVDNGKIQIVQSSFSDNDKTLSILDAKGFDAVVSANLHQFFEDITLITAVLK